MGDTRRVRGSSVPSFLGNKTSSVGLPRNYMLSIFPDIHITNYFQLPNPILHFTFPPPRIPKMPPTPFQISVPQSKIDMLKSKLSAAQFPDELQSSQWDYGAPLADIQRLTKAFSEWDWRLAEEELNRVPQYTTGIKVDGFDELDVHFVWQKSEVKNAVPLLFVHGVSDTFLLL
jgi:hypothetical protein